MAEGKAPAGYRPGYPPYGGQYAARAQGRSPASIAQTMLGAHDVIRVRVGLPPLVWSDQLARVAQERGPTIWSHTGSFEPSPKQPIRGKRLQYFGRHCVPTQVISYWARGGRGDMMFAAIPASVSAAITRRSYGAPHEQWAAPSPPIGAGRSGYATTIRP